jgi:ribosomal protein L13
VQQKTYYPKASEIERKWYVADASGQNLGRLAARVLPRAARKVTADIYARSWRWVITWWW